MSRTSRTGLEIGAKSDGRLPRDRPLVEVGRHVDANVGDIDYPIGRVLKSIGVTRVSHRPAMRPPTIPANLNVLGARQRRDDENQKDKRANRVQHNRRAF